MIPEAYAAQLRALLPRGGFFSEDQTLDALFLACGDELARSEADADARLAKRQPENAGDSLARWEERYSLPSTGTDAERAARILAYITRTRRTRPADYLFLTSPLLGRTPEELTFFERGSAFAQIVNDEREIFRFFIWRDPEAPGAYDIPSAQAFIDDYRQAHTKGYVFESWVMRCNDPLSLCDRDLIQGAFGALQTEAGDSLITEEGGLFLVTETTKTPDLGVRFSDSDLWQDAAAWRDVNIWSA